MTNGNRIQLPTLIYQGLDDSLVSIEGARALARAIAAEESRLVELPQMRHETHHESETDRRRVFDMLVDWSTAAGA